MRRSLLAFVVFSVLSGVAQAQSYPLQCRGGVTIGLVASTKSAVVYYAKAPHRAGAGLAPGQCAWMDRAIGAGEPPCLQQNNVNAVAWITSNNMPSSRAATSTHFQPNETRVEWMRKLLSTDEYMTFYAYNPGNGGCFVVTSP
jgi:hypothetical protein